MDAPDWVWDLLLIVVGVVGILVVAKVVGRVF